MNTAHPIYVAFMVNCIHYISENHQRLLSAATTLAEFSGEYNGANMKHKLAMHKAAWTANIIPNTMQEIHIDFQILQLFRDVRYLCTL